MWAVAVARLGRVQGCSGSSKDKALPPGGYFFAFLHTASHACSTHAFYIRMGKESRARAVRVWPQHIAPKVPKPKTKHESDDVVHVGERCVTCATFVTACCIFILLSRRQAALSKWWPAAVACALVVVYSLSIRLTAARTELRLRRGISSLSLLSHMRRLALRAPWRRALAVGCHAAMNERSQRGAPRRDAEIDRARRQCAAAPQSRTHVLSHHVSVCTRHIHFLWS